MQMLKPPGSSCLATLEHATAVLLESTFTRFCFHLEICPRFFVVQLFLSKCPCCVMFLTSHLVLSLVSVCSEEVSMTIMSA